MGDGSVDVNIVGSYIYLYFYCSKRRAINTLKIDEGRLTTIKVQIVTEVPTSGR